MRHSFYPFTAPPVNPEIKYFCKNKKMMITGISTIQLAADNGPHAVPED
jgi:hypothetical protein